MDVLIVKIGAIGDAVMALGAANWLKINDPSTRITWVAGSKIVPLLHSTNIIDSIIIVNEDILFGSSRLNAMKEVFCLWRKLSGTHYDLAVIGHKDKRYKTLIFPVRCRDVRMLGLVNGRQNPVPGRYHGDELLRLVSGVDSHSMPSHSFPALSIDPPDEATLQRLGPKDRPWIILFPGSAKNHLREDPLRRWPIHSYVDLSCLLLEKGYQVILSGAKSDFWVCDYFRSKKIDVVDMIGKTDFNALLWIISCSDVVVAHDSGPMHLAILLQKKILALFGPTNPEEKLPRDYSPGLVILRNGSCLPCSPCYDGKNYADCDKNLCMENIFVKDAEIAIGELLLRRDL